jgi:hypothetical protein
MKVKRLAYWVTYPVVAVLACLCFTIGLLAEGMWKLLCQWERWCFDRENLAARLERW